MLDEFKRERRLYISIMVLFVVVLAGVIYILRRPEPRVITITTPAPRPTATLVVIQVQVSGAVAKPGVYKMPDGSRLTDALDKAGGALAEADTSKLNLARKLKDGESLAVPVRTATPATSLLPTIRSTGTIVASPGATAQKVGTVSIPTVVIAGKININTASIEQLDKLPKIGPVLAQRIVDYRTQTGPFQRIEEIKNVTGIGDSLFEGIKDLICVSDE